MPEFNAEALRPVWRRAAAQPRVAGADEPLRCGGPELSAEERFQLMRERRLARKAEEERGREEADARSASRHSSAAKVKSDDDEDEDRAAERFRNDRYAVKLLHQEDSVWGGGGAGSGMLG
ncbi:hypothetical protein GCM10010435_42930 [Winogradskya consettensis]|uniref:Uncharacterized protein n=1 Tax=Winogradskya consettensis TaxID=113560 RepID=A0A919SSX1_9ACTN|nr:hypothetical protein [Actinoplanes consettensis]GIM77932.1 hypothetical protein Aco04nite_57840 [Actinoplanes consettensis]